MTRHTKDPTRAGKMALWVQAETARTIKRLAAQAGITQGELLDLAVQTLIQERELATFLTERIHEEAS